MKSVYSIAEKAIKECLELAEQLKEATEILEKIKKERSDDLSV